MVWGAGWEWGALRRQAWIWWSLRLSMGDREAKNACIPGISALGHVGEKDDILKGFRIIYPNGFQWVSTAWACLSSNSDLDILSRYTQSCFGQKKKIQKWDRRSTISASLYQKASEISLKSLASLLQQNSRTTYISETQQWRRLQAPWLSSSALTQLPPPQPTRDFTCTPRHTARGGLEREWLPEVWASLYVFAVDSLLFGVSRLMFHLQYLSDRHNGNQS